MSRRFMLDTDVLSFHLRESSPKLQRKLRATRADEVVLSVVTEMEVRYGLARNPSLRIRPQVEQLLDAMTILPLDSSVASAYARIRADLTARGCPIGPLDTMIAAHAVAAGVMLVTRNTAEMTRVAGLRCEDWTR